ncbi:hypothetical protein [Simplicispira psychrophila]|uniref:hypothetical protein n=1 Tax=Simplicispira psychrophila TaxID=80882 RepID=UPI001FE10478|nr:hypothetical protein [Simplicispira psychrophila]
MTASLAGSYSHAASTQEPTLPRAYAVNIPQEGVAKIPFHCAMGAITCIEVISTSTQTQPSVPLTWGQVFKAGDWQHTTQRLIGQVDNTTIPLQTDEISSHRDGSARFAVISAQLANLPPGQRRTINFYTTNKTILTYPATPPSEPDWNLEIEAKIYDADHRVISTLLALPQEQLKAQIANNIRPRLQGPVTTEYTLLTPFKNTFTGQPHPHLSVRLDTRLYDGGQRIRTDVILENTRTWTAHPANITYSLVIKRHGEILYEQPAFTHYHHARWHKVVWSGGAEPAQRMRYDMPYFMASRATWNYDLNLTVPESVLTKKYAQLKDIRKTQEALGPMGNVFLTPAFGTTGARADIGPLPEWTVYYLLSQDERAREVMLANADAAGSVPIHYRDEETDQPLDVQKHPTVSVLFGTSKPLLPAITDRTIWSPDTAHQASFAYIPYLVTGDKFYLDETIFWAAWNIASVNSGYRNLSEGLIRSNQVRAQAWALRSIGEAVRVLPDDHAMKKYFDVRLTNNLNSFANHIGDSPLGAIHHHPDISKISPWQNDYVSIVLSLLAENNDPKALEALQWLSQFTAGRFLNEDNGFCVAKAPSGELKYRDMEGKYITKWKELFSLNYPSDAEKPCNTLTITEGYPQLSLGYAASARAMLAANSNAGIPGAKSAYLQWKGMTPRMDEILPSAPTWAIIPR